MALSTPLWMQNGSYRALEDRALIGALVPTEGVTSPLALKVTQRSPLSLNVEVAPGGVFIRGDDVVGQGSYYVYNDAAIQVGPFTAPAAGNHRIDTVCIRINDPDASGPAGDNASLIIVSGTQVPTSSTPSAPSVPASAYPLANVAITAAQTQITDSNITNRRGLCGGIDHIGTVLPWAGSTTIVPSGYLVADGSAVSRSTYADLFEVMGIGWGEGDGSTTFNLPDLRGRTLIGAGSGAGLSARALAQLLGAETHTLATGELPSHAHSLGSHTHSASTGISGSHAHTAGGTGGQFYTRDLASGLWAAAGSSGGFNYQIWPHPTTQHAGDHGHSVTVGAAVGNTGSAGSGQSHNNMQPSAVVNYLIRAL